MHQVYSYVKMVKDKDESDLSPRHFKVLPLAPNEEYILSDPVSSETLFPSRMNLSMELKPTLGKVLFETLDGDKIRLRKPIKDIKDELVHSEEVFLPNKKESEFEDIGIEEDLMRFVSYEEIVQKPQGTCSKTWVKPVLPEVCKTEEIGKAEETLTVISDTTKNVNGGEQHGGFNEVITNISQALPLPGKSNKVKANTRTSDSGMTQKRDSIEYETNKCVNVNFSQGFIVNNQSFETSHRSNEIPSRSKADVERVKFNKNPETEDLNVVWSNIPSKYKRNLGKTNTIDLTESNPSTTCDSTSTSISDNAHKAKTTTLNLNLRKNDESPMSHPELFEMDYRKSQSSSKKDAGKHRSLQKYVFKHLMHVFNHQMREKPEDAKSKSAKNVKNAKNLISPKISQITTTQSSLLQNPVLDSTTNFKVQEIATNNCAQYLNKSNIDSGSMQHNNRCNAQKKCISCKICSKIFDRESHLIRHMSQTHCEEKTFVCESCCKAYKSKFALDYHILSYHNQSSHKTKCKKCRKFFANKDELQHHTERAHLSTKTDMPETCDICQKVFENRSYMQNHKKLKHNIYSKEFICNDCSAVFSDKNRLVAHIQTLHMAPEQKCSICGDKFPTKNNLRAHLLKNHGKGFRKSPYLCETCGKAKKTKDALQNHILTHSDIKSYVCEDCGKRFRTITNLIQHSKTHSDIRPFNCNLCDKSFRIRHHLRQHMAVHGMASISRYSRKNRTSNDILHEESSTNED